MTGHIKASMQMFGRETEALVAIPDDVIKAAMAAGNGWLFTEPKEPGRPQRRNRPRHYGRAGAGRENSRRAHPGPSPRGREMDRRRHP